jgi:hypothetical protein
MIEQINELKEISESITYYRYSNGYMVELDGRDQEDDYKTIKLICSTLDEVFSILREVDKLELR